MKAMRLEACSNLPENGSPLILRDVPVPEPAASEILIRIGACGVCHTELDEIEGRTAPPRLPVIPGHQVVGTVSNRARTSSGFVRGPRRSRLDFFRVRRLRILRSGRENLCAGFRATGRDADGGYAEYMAVHAEFAYPIPGAFSDAEAAPLLCAGAIGYRSVRLAELRRVPIWDSRVSVHRRI